MSDVHTIDLKAIGARVRARRQELGISSLETLADQIKEKGCERPSTAKLSRIEAGVQPVTTDILSELADLTGIPPEELRPDLAAKFPREPDSPSPDQAREPDPVDAPAARRPFDPPDRKTEEVQS